MDRNLDFKLWSYLIFPFFILAFLGFPKLAFFYLLGNELFWEDDDFEEDDNLVEEEDILSEDLNELDYKELPFFFTPSIISSNNIENGFEEAWHMLSSNLLFRNLFQTDSKFSIIFWLDWKFKK